MNLAILRCNMVAIGFQSLKLLMTLVWKVLEQNLFFFFFFQAIHLSMTNSSVQFCIFYYLFLSEMQSLCWLPPATSTTQCICDSYPNTGEWFCCIYLISYFSHNIAFRVVTESSFWRTIVLSKNLHLMKTDSAAWTFDHHLHNELTENKCQAENEWYVYFINRVWAVNKLNQTICRQPTSKEYNEYVPYTFFWILRLCTQIKTHFIFTAKAVIFLDIW